MNALILAAGVSRRLYPHTYDKPKCLLEVNNKPIIHYQLDALKALNIKDMRISMLRYTLQKIQTERLKKK